MYKLEIFDQSMSYVSVCFTQELTIELDYLAYTPFQVSVSTKTAKKGFYVHITKDGETVADCVIADVKPDNKMQTLSLRPLQAVFDVDVFFNAVTDAITWIATNLDDQFVSNADTHQLIPLNISYTAASDDLPLVGYNLNPTINILSVICNAFSTWNVVTECSLDLPNSRINVNIYQQTATQTIECDLENIIEKEITLGDSYGSTNKLIIKKTVDEGTPSGTTEITYYLHPDGTINTTNTNRITPVFWQVATLKMERDWTDADWVAETEVKAKEILTPATYDNEFVLSVFEDDKLIKPKSMKLGTITTMRIGGSAYYSVLSGKRIDENIYTLTFGTVRTELTKKLSMQNRTVQGGETSGGGSGADFITSAYSTTVSINANGSTGVSASAFGMSTPSGYEPFALGRSYISSSACVFRFINIRAVEDELTAAGLRNIGSSSVSNVSVEIEVVYKSV